MKQAKSVFLQGLVIVSATLVVVLSGSCGEAGKNGSVGNTTPSSDSVAVSAPVSVSATASVSTSAPDSITWTVFPNTGGANGFGYELKMNGKTFIRQPQIPAVPGNNGFRDEADAYKVAEFVASKVRRNIMPPSVDLEELDSLGIKY